MAVQPLPAPVDRALVGDDDGPREGCCGSCSCGVQDDPVLDLRAVSWGVRESTALAVFGSVPSGGSLVVIAPEDPVDLLHLLSDEARGELEVEYLEETPGAWRLRVTRGFRLFV